MTGATNFREVGGLLTSAGASIASGQIFRSNQLSRLTPKDCETLRAIGFDVVIDLRSGVERLAQPSALTAGTGPDVVSPKPDRDGIFAQFFAQTERTAAAWSEAFGHFYVELPRIYAPEFAAMFHALAQGRLPILIHGSAGKDRTGAACALILDLLGVPLGAIVRDYMTSSNLPKRDSHFRNMFTDANLSQYGELPAECRAVMLGTDPAHIAAMLDGVVRTYGSTRSYVVEALGLTETDVMEIEFNLLD